MAHGVRSGGRLRQRGLTGWRRETTYTPEVVGGNLIADPAYMTPMWEAGLFEYEDFVTAVGDRIL
eukprot:3371691-Pyramimonas_sp.AAC.1